MSNMERNSRLACTVLILFIVFACNGGPVENTRGGTFSNTTQRKSLTTATTEVSKVNTDKDDGCGVVIKLLNVAPGKPPQRIYRVKLQMMNRHSEPLWFVFRLYGDNSLPDSGRFPGYDYKRQPFSSTQYTEKARNKSSKAVVINFLGEDGFTALRLPEGGQVILDYFVFSAFAEVSTFEVWEVNSLLVNGKTPVENWLPYKVTSDKSVHLGEHETSTSLDWDKKISNYREDYPNEKVDFVIAQPVKKCILTLAAAPKRRRG
jgi:hypothetical protein